MSYVYEKAALSILEWFHHAERDLVGRAIVTTSAEAGTIKAIKLDEHHGLCFTLDDPVDAFDAVERGIARRFYPVSTIKFKAP